MTLLPASGPHPRLITWAVKYAPILAHTLIQNFLTFVTDLHKAKLLLVIAALLAGVRACLVISLSSCPSCESFGKVSGLLKLYNKSCSCSCSCSHSSDCGGLFRPRSEEH